MSSYSETDSIFTAAGFVGDVTGDLTGDVTGDVTGDITGDITGAVLTSDGVGTVYAKESLPIVAATTANDTTIIVPDGAVIKAVYVVVDTLEATGTTKTIDIGISGGDENGFLDGVSVAAAGTIKGTLASAGQTLGALLQVDEDGSGAVVPEPYVCTAATTICYSLAAADYAEMVASVVVIYDVLG